MSLQLQPFYQVPEKTAEIARALFLFIIVLCLLAIFYPLHGLVSLSMEFLHLTGFNRTIKLRKLRDLRNRLKSQVRRTARRMMSKS